MLRLSILPAIVLSFAATVQAAPLVPAHVSAKAKWVSHLNLEAVRSTPLASKWHEKWSEKEGFKDKVAKITEMMGMNPMQDLLGVTIYDTTYERHNGVLLMHLAAGHQKSIGEAFKKNKPDAKTSEYGGRTLSTWMERKGSHGEHEMTGCFANERTIVLSRDPDRVKAALAVIDGKQKSLAKDSPLLQGFPKQALIATHVIDVDEEYQAVTRCPVLKNSDAASFSVIHKNDVTRMKCTLQCNSEEQAQSYADVVQGFRAMVQLRHGGDESVARVMQGLKTKAKGTAFSVTWQASSDDIEAAVKQGMQRREQMRERWQKMKEHSQQKDASKKPGKADKSS